MTKIEEGLKLDFHNVLIRPKRSTINSRSNVNLMRTIKFKNCKSLKSWEGIPIIASNMDTVGTFDVYKTLSKFKIIGPPAILFFIFISIHSLIITNIELNFIDLLFVDK